MSTSNSPSVSEQFNSATTQTNQVLSMSGGESGSSTTFSITPMPTVGDSPQVIMADVQVQDMQGEINTAVSGVMTASEADQVADQCQRNCESAGRAHFRVLVSDLVRGDFYGDWAAAADLAAGPRRSRSIYI